VANLFLMGDNFKMVAKTMFGFEGLLAKELRQLGAMDVREGIRNVSFVGDNGFMYKASLALRTAVRILKPIKKFRVNSEDELYKQLQLIKWEQYFNENGTFAIDAVVNSDNFTHSHIIQR